MTDDHILTYDASKSSQPEVISPKISLLNDVGYDFELQTVYYIHDSHFLYSINMITRDRKVTLFVSNIQILSLFYFFLMLPYATIAVFVSVRHCIHTLQKVLCSVAK